MDNNTKSSILKLRRLRDELCKKQAVWKDAFKIKDCVVSELETLKSIANDPESTKDKIVTKIDSILILIDGAGLGNPGDKDNG